MHLRVRVTSFLIVLLTAGGRIFAGGPGLVGSILPPTGEQVAVVSGTVALTGRDDRLVLFVDRSDAGVPTDGRIDAVIRVGLGGRVPQGELRRLKDATLEVSPRRVVLTAPEGPVALEFSIDSQGTLPLVGLPPDETFRRAGSRLVGAVEAFEIAVCVPRSGETIARAVAHVVAGDSPYLPNGACYSEDCQAGGMGSTSCSVTKGGNACSVSCGHGFFACCNVGMLTGAHCFCCPIPR